MTLWLSLSALLALAVVLLARPFLRRFSEETAASNQDVALFREQIRELEQELEKGALIENEAQETRREIERRILNSTRKFQGEEMNASNNTVRIAGIAMTLGWLSVGSVFLYKVVGQPDMAFVAPPEMSTMLPETRQPLALASPRERVPAAQEALADVDTMISRLAKRLENEPGDINGWRMLAWSYQKTDNLGGAVEAYARAAELAPDDAELLSLYGEAVTRANEGVVVPRAQEIFTRSLRLKPQNHRAGFFDGLALHQDGQSRAALEKWLEILSRAPEDADWLPGLVARIREVASTTNYDLGDQLSQFETRSTQSQPLSNPTQEDIAAAAKMTDDERKAMILSMVESLSGRLETSPNDPDGWARLIRSYVVLNDRPKALMTLEKARQVFAQDANALAQVNATAKSLSLNQ